MRLNILEKSFQFFKDQFKLEFNQHKKQTHTIIQTHNYTNTQLYTHTIIHTHNYTLP
jgi:hypothetical protein